MNFKQRKWLKRCSDFNFELGCRAGNKLQQSNCKSMNKKLSGTFVGVVRKGKKNGNAKTAEECTKIQSKITRDNYKQYKREELGGGPFTIFSLSNQERTFSRPIDIGFTVYELSMFLTYKVYYMKLQSNFGENNLKFNICLHIHVD